MNRSGDLNFTPKMINLARYLVVGGAFFLAFVACFTTWEGLKLVIAAWAAVPTAIGIQAMAFGSETLAAHGQTLRQRVFGLSSFVVSESVSFAFTFLFFFTFLNARVALQQNKTYEAAEFRRQRSELQIAGAKVKATEAADLDQQDLDLKTQAKLFSADAETRRHQAENLVDENKKLVKALLSANAAEQEAIWHRIRRNEYVIRNCRADASTLRLRVATNGAQASQIGSRREVAAGFTPDFLGVKDGDWEGLTKQFETLAAAYGRLADAGTVALPPAPGRPVFGKNGQILRGEDDQFNEVLRRVQEPWDGAVWWTIILSAAVEFPGFIALLATRQKGVDLPARIHAMGVWLRRLRRSLQAAQGVIPLAFKSVFRLLFGKPEHRGHPTVTAYEDFIEDLQAHMSGKFRAMTAPATLITILETRLDSLYASLIHRNYTLVAELDDEVNDFFDSCVATVKVAALTEEQERQFIGLLMEQTERLRRVYRAGDGNHHDTTEYSPKEKEYESAKADAE
jgi:hypothetical protein